MRKNRGVIVLASAVILAFAGCGGTDGGGAGGPGRIACTSLDAEGRADGAVLLLDPDGTIAATVDLGDDEVPMPEAGGAGPWVLYGAPISSPHQWFLNPSTGEVRELPDGSPRFSEAPAGRMGIATNPDGGSWLVTAFDFSTGAATDLSRIAGGGALQAGLVLAPADPTGGHLLVWDPAGGGTWVIPVDDPADAWRTGERDVPGGFSLDGTRAVVVRSEPRALAVVDLASREVTSLAEGRWFAPAFAADGRVIAVGDDGLSLVAEGGTAEVLYTPEDGAVPAARPVVAPGGEAVLAGFEADATTWVHADLASGEVRTLAVPDGLRPVAAAGRYLVLGGGGEPPMLTRLAVLDVADGSVSSVSLADPVQPYLPKSPAGDTVLLIGRAGMAVLDLASAETRALPDGSIGAAYSPDGSRLAVAVRPGGPETTRLAVASVIDPSAADVLEAACSWPVWAPGA